MQLSARLHAIADMVTEGNRLVDVGCDHGFLPVFLVLNGKIPSAIASDVRTGPLSRAQEHIREYGLQNQIETRLSDGLQHIQAGDGDTLVIAGMGGGLMERILDARPAVRDSFQELVLSPQSEIPGFRQYLLDRGFFIEKEQMIREDDKYYLILRAVKAQNPEERERFARAEISFGKLLLAQQDPVLLQYLQREEGICQGILAQLAGRTGDAIERRREEISVNLEIVREAMGYYEDM